MFVAADVEIFIFFSEKMFRIYNKLFVVDYRGKNCFFGILNKKTVFCNSRESVNGKT